MTAYDNWLPVARKIVAGLAAKPGIKIVDREIAAQFLAQALCGAAKRGELPSDSVPPASAVDTGEKT